MERERREDRRVIPQTRAFWTIAVLAVVIAGLALPPLGAVLGLGLAAVAQKDGRHDLRAAGLFLFVVFIVLTLLIGVTLLDTSGGSSSGQL